MIELEHNITCLDTEHIRANFVAAYLIQSGDEVAFIDTGCHLSVPNLLNALKTKNIAFKTVKYIIITHIHLDHAGGAGELVKHLPQATVLVHAQGYNHLLDPCKLKAGVIKVYGKTFFKQFLGDLLPIPKNRIQIVKDNQTIMLNKRALKIIYTEGHAKHHFCIWDEESGGMFAGDTLGVSYREFDNKNGYLLFPPTSPNQFNPDAWIKTLQRITRFKIKYAYLTHFGRINFSQQSADCLAQRIQDFTHIALAVKKEKNRNQAIKSKLLDYLLKETQQHNSQLDEKTKVKLFKGDLEICAQGLSVWLDQTKN
jgi:glyoxylase-like metal-dependent hydrolase (beta-lactamase superfamily II)